MNGSLFVHICGSGMPAQKQTHIFWNALRLKYN